MMTSLSGFAAMAARRGAAEARRAAERIAAVAAAQDGVARAVVEDEAVKLVGRGLRRRWRRGDAALLGLLEDVRALVRRA